ncbi:MAG: 30S ribosomal protein S9, partial [Candidatus Aenigmatarchaeota archaeon]
MAGKVKKGGDAAKGTEKIFTGKRKRAVSRVRLVPGAKRIVFNGKALEEYPKIVQLKVSEPLILAGEDGFDVKINANGGGIMGQAEASAQGITKALVAIK